MIKHIWATLLTISLVVCLAQAAGAPRIGLTLDNYTIWPSDHIFNTRIDDLPTLPNSAVLASNLGSGEYGVVPCSALSAVDNSVSIEEVATPLHQGTNFGRILTDQPTEQQYLLTGGDHSFDNVNPDDNTMFNVYSWYPPKQPDGSYEASHTYMYNLSGYDVNEQRNGIPIITQHDAESGLDHMIPATIENIHSGRYWPGATFGQSGFSTDVNYPVVGMIFRLKSSVDITKYDPEQQNILKGLKEYGFIVDDKNDVGEGISSPMESPDTMELCYRDYFEGITANDFEAVDVSSLMIDPASGKVKTSPQIGGEDTQSQKPLVNPTQIPNSTSVIVPTQLPRTALTQPSVAQKEVPENGTAPQSDPLPQRYLNQTDTKPEPQVSPSHAPTSSPDPITRLSRYQKWLIYHRLHHS